ncbi:MAG: alpha/beta hydrolase [Gillisia sp.]
MTRFYALFVFVLLSLSSYSQNNSIPYGNNPQAGNYIAVNGIKLYYEIYGKGEPLLLFHGNGGNTSTQKNRIEFFSKHYKVIAIDSRAQGKSTDDLDIPLTYQQMSEDINSLMDTLHIQQAYMWGQSDGGILGILLAINHPEKVKKLATFGLNVSPGEKAIPQEIREMVMDTLTNTKSVKIKRLYSLLAYQPNSSLEDLHKIKCPVMLMVGDRDIIKIEHTLSIFNNIDNSNLFVMPGATHLGAYEKPDIFNMVLWGFFKNPFSKVSSVELFAGKK